MYPILFEIPILGVPLRSFGLMVVLGFLLGAHLFSRFGERYALDREAEAPGYASVPMWILVGIMLGARAMYVIVEVFRGSETGQRYLDDPLTVFYYWEGGLVMYGGTFGGIALGLDRWVMLMGGYDNIRDVIAFPKTQKAADMMTEAPGAVDAKQLKELAGKAGGKVVVVEDHYPEGGLGDAVNQALYGSGIVLKQKHLAVRSVPKSGPPDVLIDAFGISSKHIVEAVMALNA